MRLMKIALLIGALIASRTVFASQASIALPTSGTYSGATMVGYINAANGAISSMQSGSGDPGTAGGAYSFWADTSNTLLKQRNASNTGWVTIGPLLTRLASQSESQNASNLSAGTVPTARLPAGSTSAAGVLQLVDATNSTSTTTAATPNAVKAAYDLAAAAAPASTTLTTNSTQTVSAVKTFSGGAEPLAKNTAKAWVKFDCTTGTCVIADSFNVSSMTYNTTGDYTINFTTAMSNANYAWAGMARRSSNGMAVVDQSDVTAPTTSALRINVIHVIGGGTIGFINLPASVVVFGG